MCMNSTQRATQPSASLPQALQPLQLYSVGLGYGGLIRVFLTTPLGVNKITNSVGVVAVAGGASR